MHVFYLWPYLLHEVHNTLLSEVSLFGTFRLSCWAFLTHGTGNAAVKFLISVAGLDEPLFLLFLSFQMKNISLRFRFFFKSVFQKGPLTIPSDGFDLLYWVLF